MFLTVYGITMCELPHEYYDAHYSIPDIYLIEDILVVGFTFIFFSNQDEEQNIIISTKFTNKFAS
jgi:hypothetical protein